MIVTQEVNKSVNLDSRFRGNDIRNSANDIRDSGNDSGEVRLHRAGIRNRDDEIIITKKS